MGYEWKIEEILGVWHFDCEHDNGDGANWDKIKCPYGKHGEIRALREPLGKCDNRAWYKDDGRPAPNLENQIKWRWKVNTLSQLYMPYEVARTFVKIKDIRVERVQEISDEDILAEGIKGDIYGDEINIAPKMDMRSARIYFMELWDSINKKRGYGWNENCWCWVVEFERIKAWKHYQIQ
jgi:hypothetical protein